MELDELKNIWQKGTPFQPKVEQELAAMLTGRSSSIIGKLKRSVWIELLFTAVACIMLLYFSFIISSGALKWSFIAFLILFGGYIVYYLKQLTIFHNFEAQHENLRIRLSDLIKTLERYLKFYKVSYSLLYPVYFALILSFVIIEKGMDGFVMSLHDPKILTYLIALIGVLIFSSLWFTNWYLKKLYGDHVEKLRAVLRDLEDEAKE